MGVINKDRIDTRIRQSILYDARFIADMSGDEFRAYHLLLVWVVGEISDGQFSRDRAVRTIGLLTAGHIDRFIEIGLVDADGDACLMTDFEGKQTSRAELERQAQDRAKGRERTARHRAKNAAAEDRPVVADVEINTPPPVDPPPVAIAERRWWAKVYNDADVWTVCQKYGLGTLENMDTMTEDRRREVIAAEATTHGVKQQNQSGVPGMPCDSCSTFVHFASVFNDEIACDACVKVTANAGPVPF